MDPSWKVLGGVLEALGGVLEACGSVLEALGGVLEALEGVLKASWRLLKSSWRPRWVKIALESKNIWKIEDFGPPAGGILDVLEALGGVWFGLEGVLGVLEALGGVLKAKMSQDSVKIGPRTRQERNPRELPSGLSPQSRRSQVQRAAVGSGRRQWRAWSIFLLEEEHY